MTCREFIEFLYDYVAGELPEAERIVFEAHLADCPSCVAYLKSYRETIKLGRTALACDESALPDDVPDDLVQAVLAARRSLS